MVDPGFQAFKLPESHTHKTLPSSHNLKPGTFDSNQHYTMAIAFFTPGVGALGGALIGKPSNADVVRVLFRS